MPYQQFGSSRWDGQHFAPIPDLERVKFGNEAEFCGIVDEVEFVAEPNTDRLQAEVRLGRDLGAWLRVGVPFRGPLERLP